MGYGIGKVLDHFRLFNELIFCLPPFNNLPHTFYRKGVKSLLDSYFHV
jgi:hypothetical protein